MFKRSNLPTIKPKPYLGRFEVFFLFSAIITIFVSMLIFQSKLHASEKESSHSGSVQREFSLIAGDHGFFPSRFVAYTGERVRFYVTSITDLPSCLIFEGKDFFIEAKKGEVRGGELVFNNSGTYRFYCPKGRIEGRLTVLDHPRDERENRWKRDLASENKEDLNVWMPKDD